MNDLFSWINRFVLTMPGETKMSAPGFMANFIMDMIATFLPIFILIGLVILIWKIIHGARFWHEILGFVLSVIIFYFAVGLKADNVTSPDGKYKQFLIVDAVEGSLFAGQRFADVLAYAYLFGPQSAKFDFFSNEVPDAGSLKLNGFFFKQLDQVNEKLKKTTLLTQDGSINPEILNAYKQSFNEGLNNQYKEELKTIYKLTKELYNYKVIEELPKIGDLDPVTGVKRIERFKPIGSNVILNSDNTLNITPLNLDDIELANTATSGSLGNNIISKLPAQIKVLLPAGFWGSLPAQGSISGVVPQNNSYVLKAAQELDKKLDKQINIFKVEQNKIQEEFNNPTTIGGLNDSISLEMPRAYNSFYCGMADEIKSISMAGGKNTSAYFLPIFFKYSKACILTSSFIGKTDNVKEAINIINADEMQQMQGFFNNLQKVNDKIKSDMQNVANNQVNNQGIKTVSQMLSEYMWVDNVAVTDYQFHWVDLGFLYGALKAEILPKTVMAMSINANSYLKDFDEKSNNIIAAFDYKKVQDQYTSGVTKEGNKNNLASSIAGAYGIYNMVAEIPSVSTIVGGTAAGMAAGPLGLFIATLMGVITMGIAAVKTSFIIVGIMIGLQLVFFFITIVLPAIFWAMAVFNYFIKASITIALFPLSLLMFMFGDKKSVTYNTFFHVLGVSLIPAVMVVIFMVVMNMSIILDTTASYMIPGLDKEHGVKVVEEKTKDILHGRLETLTGQDKVRMENALKGEETFLGGISDMGGTIVKYIGKGVGWVSDTTGLTGKVVSATTAIAGIVLDLLNLIVLFVLNTHLYRFFNRSSDFISEYLGVSANVNETLHSDSLLDKLQLGALK